MDAVKAIIEQLRVNTKHDTIRPLRDAFAQLPAAERQMAEAELIEMLNDDQVSRIARSWVPAFLALVGTPTARQTLIDQLPIEEDDYVRTWIARNLVESFTGDDRLVPIMKQLEREEIWDNRLYLTTWLVKAHNPVTIPLLIKLLGDDYGSIRGLAARGLGQLKAEQAVEPLIRQLKDEDRFDVKQSIIGALGAIRDSQASSALLDLLRDKNLPSQLHMAVAQALGELAVPSDQDAIDLLLETTCHADRVVALTATNTLLKLLSSTEAAQRIAGFGLKQTAPYALSRVADALRLIGGTDAVNYLRTVSGDPVQEKRAQILLEQIGGAHAFDVLITSRLSRLEQAEKRVKEFDDQALTIFKGTIREAKRGFAVSIGMSITIFVVGVVLLGVSIYLMAQPDFSQQLLGASSGLTGMGTILAMFYRGPLERIERSVANLVQTEIAFLGYIRQVTQITAMFEREYLDSEGFGLKELKRLLEYTEHAMKETMPLVNQYTAVLVAASTDEGETDDSAA